MTRKNGRMRWVGALILLTAMAAAAQAQDRAADHDELRAMLKTVTAALNSRNLETIAPLCHEKFAITTVDQQVFTGLPAFETYFKGLFAGEKASLKSITFNPTADVLTEFVGENTGLARGTSTDTYVFADGDTRTMTSHWSATLYKDGGKWKIVRAHIGANPLENPVTSALRGMLYKVGIGAGLAGLGLGVLLARLLRGRSR